MSANEPQHRIRFDEFIVDLHTQEMWRAGIKVKLIGQPLQILLALLQEPGKLIAREELQKRLWSQDVFVDSNHGLNAAANKLRDSLNDSALDPRYIETLPRRGYRFIGKVEPIAPEVDVVADPIAFPRRFALAISALPAISFPADEGQ